MIDFAAHKTLHSSLTFLLNIPYLLLLSSRDLSALDPPEFSTDEQTKKEKVYYGFRLWKPCDTCANG